jgi:hypothetical protein
MARKKKAKGVKIAGVRVPNSAVKAAWDFANTPLGRLLLAEALILAAGVLARSRPASAAKTAATGAAETATDFAAAAGDATLNVLQAAADRLKASAGLAYGGPAGKPDRSRKAGSARTESRSEVNSVWDDLSPEAIRQAVQGDIRRKKKGKKAKRGKAALS